MIKSTVKKLISKLSRHTHADADEEKPKSRLTSNCRYLFSSNNLWLHDVHFHNLKSDYSGGFRHVFGYVNRQLILHSNIPEFHVTAATSVFQISFECFGHFECVHFRLTSNNPSDLYKEIIIYPSSLKQNCTLFVGAFDVSKPIVLEFNVYGSNIDLYIGKVCIEFFDAPESPVELQDEIDLPSFVGKYKRDAIVRDYHFLLSPEPHSQERGLVLLQYMNHDAKKTIDLGAGCAPMMADLILRESNSDVDCLVFGDQDAAHAKRTLSEYGGRVNVFAGDLTRIESIPDKTYDQILLIDVLEHINDDSLVLENIKKLFHANSRLIISVPNVNYKHTFSEEFHDLVGHLRDGYSLDVLQEKLESLGYLVHYGVNYSGATKEFYRLWYADLKAWSNSFKYTQTAFERSCEFLTQLKERRAFLPDLSARGEEGLHDQGVSNLLICTLIQ
jgi:SAM-dependent methyltransferase